MSESSEVGSTDRQIGDLRGRWHCCPICNTAEPRWTITREGDVATSWACATDLDRVLELMQRDHEVTRLVVRSAPKAREWAELASALRDCGHPNCGASDHACRPFPTTPSTPRGSTP